MPAALLTHAMPYWLPALFVLAIYRRIRRNFGVQAWQPVRAGIRLAVLSLVACALIALSFLKPEVLIPLSIGGALGGAMGLFGLKHTHVAWSEGKRVYNQNPWIGSILTAILLGRLAWRWTHDGLLAAQQSPSMLTLGLAAVLIAYSLVYVCGLMLQMKRLQENGQYTTHSGTRNEDPPLNA